MPCLLQHVGLADRGTIGSALQLQHGETAADAIAGHAVEDADPVIGNFIARRVSWRGASDLRALAGDEVFVRLVAADASIFSVTLACAS